jgi:AraC family transcriptional regulator of adaptative response / DNA-3-methyladenine glycosylase II
VTLDPKACYRALAARDARFDGRFFVGVTTTGVYCRPICPARTPGRARCQFYARAAEAEHAGFRACFRCRPELSPGLSLGTASVDAVSRLVATAAARIEAGALNEIGVDALAAELGVTGRHLRRAMKRELGLGPLELAQSSRLAIAKQLVHDGTASLTNVAIASGFGSLRRFNAAFRAHFGCAPSQLRRAPNQLRRAPNQLRRASHSPPSDGVVLRLGYRPPFDWPLVLGYLAGRRTRGVELVADGAYARTIAIGDARGVIVVRDEPERRTLRVEIDPALVPVAPRIAATIRRMFDLRADPRTIAKLGRDPALKSRLARHPGIRIVGGFSGFEIAVRAVLGQQVTVAAATTLAGRVVQRFGTPIATHIPELTHLPITPHAIAAASIDELAGIGMPGARAQGLQAIGAAFAAGAVDLEPGADPERAHAALCSIRGIGPWTASYVVLRALGDPDAFPDDDLGLRRALDLPDRRALVQRAEAWRPWRGYAAMLLWNAGAHDEDTT